MYIPVIGRVYLREWPYLIIYFSLAWIEFVISVLTNCLPSWFIRICTDTTQFIYWYTSNHMPLVQFFAKRLNDRDEFSQTTLMSYHLSPDVTKSRYERMLKMIDDVGIEDMCAIFGYEVESHLVETGDGYFLTVHRIINRNSKVKKNGKVVYLHHGLLMSSEIWVTMLDKNLNLPYILFELGYDVWLGNNRGGKYSQKHLKHKISSEEFWNFSLDEFAIYDIPDTIDFILEITNKKSLQYVGFSQGTTQAFASVSINTELSKKIERIIAISPATTPHGLYSKFLDIFCKTSPSILFLLFSRKVLMPSVLLWRRIMYPPLFIKSIDISNNLLFNWKSLNISRIQKIASFSHLYSPTSVKTVVHWFQIISAKKVQMYKELDMENISIPMSYPLKNINIPIHLIYGTIDSLVDIEVMKSQLPEKYTTVHPVEGHEHLDNIWGDDVNHVVFNSVIDHLSDGSENDTFNDKRH